MGVFRFRRFEVDDCGCGQKICSDSVMLGAWFFRDHPEAKSVLDIGTGSGLLALMAADLMADTTVEAVEIEPKAFLAAQSNFAKSPHSHRLHIRHGSFEDLPETDVFDLIVCNPPFFTNGLKAEDSDRASARHEGSLNATSLVRFAANHLTAIGHLGLISPADREQEILFEAELAGLSLNRLMRVQTSQRKPCTRLLWDFARTDCGYEESTLAIRDAANNYSPEYLTLVDDIYLTLK